MAFTNELVERTKHFEGYRSRPYKCPANILTIGYGHTYNVRLTDKITELSAHSLLVNDLKAIDIVLQEHGINLPIKKQSAIISFCFNLGFTLFKKSRLYNYVKQYDPLYDSMISALIKKYCYYHDKNGVVHESYGLKERRLWEAKAFQ